MRKILSVLAAVGLTSTAASAVVACGDGHKAEVKADLTKAFENIDLKIDGSVDMTTDNAYASFSKLDAVSAFLAKAELKQTDFVLELTSPTYLKSGSLTITVNSSNHLYKGTITVTINPIGQMALTSVTGLTKTIEGSENMDATIALTTFLGISGNEVLKDLVHTKDGSFIAPTNGGNGSFIVEANSGDVKYSGELEVAISGYKVSLNSLNLTTTIDGAEDMDATTALTTFLAISGNEFLEDQVEIKSGGENFVAPSTDAEGKLVIQARQDSTKYEGEIEITISKLAAAKKDFSTLFNKATDYLKIDGAEGMTKESAFSTFASNLVIKGILSVAGLDETDFILELTLPTTGNDGTLKISVNGDNAKFTGSITITISKLQTTVK